MRPTWSPDGSRIVYRTLADGRIISMAADGSDATPLTDGPGDADPAWSPDGTRIVFSSERDDGQVDVSGNGPSDDGQHRGSDFSPSWSE